MFLSFLLELLWLPVRENSFMFDRVMNVVQALIVYAAAAVLILSVFLE